MAKILAIDPGSEQSAWVVWDTEQRMIEDYDITTNIILGGMIFLCRNSRLKRKVDLIVVEEITSYGMPVGKTVFETCYVVGEFRAAWRYSPACKRPSCTTFCLISRRQVKLHLCNSARAKDSNIRQALIDRFGPGREKAVGTKKNPGPLYGVKKDLWSALAIAVTYCDLNLKGE